MKLTSPFVLFSFLLIAFKLGGVAPFVGWSWWWITLPLWGPTALVLCFIGALFAVIGLVFVSALVAAASGK